MKFIKTKFFEEQVKKLKNKYLKIEKDILKFENDFEIEPFSDLWWNIFKYRIRNSSIPVWKRGWFRIILKKYNNIILPLIIYSKTIKENVSDIEIIEALEKVLKEIN